MCSVFCFLQVIMSVHRIMWILWWLWIVLIIQSCDGGDDPDFASIYVEPVLSVNVKEDWIAENDSATITCSTLRVKPSVTIMTIKINNCYRVISEEIQVNATEEDKTFANSFSVSIPVTRSDNGKKVSCKAMWKGSVKTKTISSNAETLRVVWPADTPEDIKVVSGIESCNVSWRSDPNAKSVTICHEPSSGGQQCTRLTATESLRYKIVKLDPDESYSIWMYASNELGSSDNTTKQQCIPQASTTMETTTILLYYPTSSINDNGLNKPVVGVVAGGAGGGALLLISIIIIIIIIIVRKKAHKHDDTYANVIKSNKITQFSASQPGTSRNDEETPYDGPAVQGVNVKTKGVSEGQTSRYAAVAFKPTKDKKRPEVIRNVKAVEYSGVQFRTPVLDEDSD